MTGDSAYQKSEGVQILKSKDFTYAGDSLQTVLGHTVLPNKDFYAATDPYEVFQNSVQRPKAKCFPCALNGMSARVKQCRSRGTLFSNKESRS